ncbi:hypothetical protein [Streptomyces sp.]|uniref:hypothetical protein n=1 Tax=Streptomyces sp. TaxID=1931 RepID=UPI002D39AF17|nr:hypothetical protein [Streptomyces sp.]HZF88007.1 hypothetical protein [Streptomyces sp.]
MHAYEYQQMRSAELIRRAERERLAREVARDSRAARREAARRTAESESHSSRSRRLRFPRTA